MSEEEFESLERKAHNNLIRLQREYERIEYGYDRENEGRERGDFESSYGHEKAWHGQALQEA
mgnify:CR=1 FL=1